MSLTAGLFRVAQLHHRAGRLAESELIYRKVLDVNPRHAGALQFLALALHQGGQQDAALALIADALEQAPDDPQAHYHHGLILEGMGRLDEAMAQYQAALARAPGHPEARCNLAAAWLAQGRAAEALAGYDALLADRPDFEPARIGRANALAELGELEAALAAYDAVLAAHPDAAAAIANRGLALHRLGRRDEAAACFARALALAPDNPELRMNQANLDREAGRLDDAIAGYRVALAQAPRLAQAWLNLGHAQRERGEDAEARASFDRAVALRPQSAEARFARCMAELPIVYDRAEAVAERRAAYDAALDGLARHLEAADPAERAAAADAIGTSQPFHLAYQAQADCGLQATYGRLVAGLMASRYPQWSRPRRLPPRQPGEPVRVGVVSGFFRRHSISKLFQGWVTGLDPKRVAVHGYHTGVIVDAAVAAARAACRRFVQAPLPFERMVEAILADAPHVLVFPELGMDAGALRLAALRLAPVQAMSWGHPTTSGLPTIDAMLSSDLMEPSDGEAHYTEHLVRLPGLSLAYADVGTAPAAVALPPGPPDPVHYLCCQSLSKYLPQHDAVWVRIAQAVPAARFLFLAQPNRWIAQRFRDRLGAAFAAAGLDPERHLVLLDPLDAAGYAGLNRLAHVYLDSLDWSGGNTTLESLPHALPIVTLPGALMRGRHSAAILTAMGLGHRVCPTLDAYVETAVRLGRDPAERARFSAEIAAGRHQVYGGRVALEALTAWLEAQAPVAAR